MGSGPASKTYQDGAAARESGTPRSANPYRVYSKYHYPWNRGWDEQQAATEEAEAPPQTLDAAIAVIRDLMESLDAADEGQMYIAGSLSAAQEFLDRG